MYIDNKKALIILAIVIVILTAAIIIIGRIVATVEVTPKNLDLDKDISRKIDRIVDGDIEELNLEQGTINEIE